MNGLVSSHTEGFTDANGQETTERRYRYTYVNGRMSVTGHGWLGFDRRTVTESSDDRPARIVTTDFQPVLRTRLDGTAADTAAPPYVYPLAALPKAVTVDTTASTTADKLPLEGAEFGYRRRTRTVNTWEVGRSAANLPFPRLRNRTTTTFERERPGIIIGDPPPDTDDGALLLFCSDAFGTDGYGNVTSQVSECNDELTSTTTSFAPDPGSWLISNPELVTITSARFTEQTQVWDPAYDSRGLLASVTRSPNGPVSERHTTTYVRNSYGNTEQIIETVASGEGARTTTIFYDTDNIFPLTVRNPKNQDTQVRFDARWGTPKTVVDPNGISVQHVYDGLGLLAETRDPHGTSVYSYSALEPVSTQTAVGAIHPRIRVSVEQQGIDGTRTGSVMNEIDNRGRRVRTQSEGFGGSQVVTEQAYDLVGRLAGTSAPHTPGTQVVPSTRYSYDGFDRATRITHSDGTFAEHQYATTVTLAPGFRHWLTNMQCNGEDEGCPVDVERTIDEEGRENVVVTDHRGLVSRSIDGENVATTERYASYFYGAFNRTSLVRHNGKRLFGSETEVRTDFEHDPYGRLLSRNDPDATATAYTYNGFDELKTSLDPKGQLRTYDHDELGRLRKIIDAAGTTQWLYDSGINAIGRLVETISPGTAENPDGQRVLYSYEPQTATNNRGSLRRLDAVIDGVSYPVTFEYDGLGRTQRIHYPSLGAGAPVVAEYRYDSSGVLSGLDEVGSAATRQLWRLTEAFQGHLIQREHFGNGADTSYSYQADRRFLESIGTTLGSSTIQALEYTHYKNGRVHQRTSSGSSREYTYDQLNRLATSADVLPDGTPLTTNYGYDRLGNLTQRGSTTTSYRPTQPHWIDAVGDNSYQYDANGNVSQRSGPDIPGGIQTLEYTPFDLPSTVIQGQTNVVKTTRFDYSADEERVVRRDADTTRHFVADLYQRVIDNTNGGTLEERFRLYAGSRSLGEIVRKSGSAEQTLFFHTDQLDSVDTVSSDTGEVFRQEFDAFGMPLDAAGSSTELTRAGFTGHQHDQDLGLIDMKGRVYDPLAGRFTSADPVTQAPFWTQGLNRYSYVFNDPINHTDPSGFFGTDTQAGLGISGWGAGVALGAQAFGGGSAVPGIGTAVNIGISLLGAPSWLGSTGPVTLGSVAPTTTGATQGGVHAAQQNKGGIPTGVQEGGGLSLPSMRPPGTSLFDPAAGALAQCGYCEAQAEAGKTIERAIERQYERSQLKGDVEAAKKAAYVVAMAVRSAWDWIKVHARPPDNLPATGVPNSTDVVDRGNGKGTIRDYGPDGRAQKDYDFGHDQGAGDPHAHDWDWSKARPRRPGRPLKPGE